MAQTHKTVRHYLADAIQACLHSIAGGDAEIAGFMAAEAAHHANTLFKHWPSMLAVQKFQNGGNIDDV